MPYHIREIQPTPNPNAQKFLLDREIASGTLSFLSAEQAQDHPIAAQLFGISGVTSVMLLGDFVTINKSPDAEWKTIGKNVREILENL